MYIDCKIISLKQKYEFRLHGLAFHQDSPYILLFNYFILCLKEIGTKTRIAQAYDPMFPLCPGLKGKTFWIQELHWRFFME